MRPPAAIGARRRIGERPEALPSSSTDLASWGRTDPTDAAVRLQCRDTGAAILPVGRGSFHHMRIAPPPLARCQDVVRVAAKSARNASHSPLLTTPSLSPSTIAISSGQDTKAPGIAFGCGVQVDALFARHLSHGRVFALRRAVMRIRNAGMFERFGTESRIMSSSQRAFPRPAQRM